MNSKYKMLIGVALATIVASSILIIQKDSKEIADVGLDTFTSNTLENINVSEDIKKISFDSAEEMFSYAEEISTIKDIAEAEGFIKNFLSDCESNRAEAMVINYHNSIREHVLNQRAFPFYDETGSMYPMFKDIEISDNGANSYRVSYCVTIFDINNHEKIAEIYKKDDITLMKEFERISIRSYKSKTTDKKFYI